MPEIFIPFGMGVDEATSPYLVDPTRSFLSLQNCYQEKRGALSKTTGYTSLSSARFTLTSGPGSRTAGYRLGSFGTTMYTIDGEYLDSWSEQAAAWYPVGRVSPVVVGRRAGIAAVDQIYALSADVCYAGGYVAIVVNTAADTFKVVVVDATTFATVSTITWTVGVTSTQVLLAAAGSRLMALYASGANALSCKHIDLTSRSTIDTGWGTLAVATDWSGSGEGFDICSGTSRATVIYGNNSGGASGFSAVQITTTPATTGATTIASGAANVLCAVGGSQADTIWFAWAEGTNIRMQGRDPATLTSITATTATIATTAGTPWLIGLTETTTGKGVVTAAANKSGVGGAEIIWRKFQVSGGAATTDGAQATRWNVSLAVRPFYQSGRVWCAVTHADATAGHQNTQGLMVVVDITDENSDLRPAATVSARLSRFTLVGQSPHFPAASDPSHLAPMHASIKATGHVFIPNISDRELETAEAEAVLLDFNSQNLWQPVYGVGGLHLSAGVPLTFDGQSVFENGFVSRPDPPGVAAGVPSSPNGTYSCIAMYEHVDANGNVHWSAPSDPSQVVCVNQAIDWVVTTTPLTMRSPVNIVLFRTVAGGTTYYRLTYNSVLLNDKSTWFVGITEGATDAFIAGQALAYTQPGNLGTALARYGPPSLSAICLHGDRIFGLSDDGVSVFYSGAHVLGEGSWWSDAQQIAVEGDPNTAIWSQDGRVVVAKEQALYVIDGDGPPDNGGNGTEFSLPRKLTSDVGCIAARSLVTTEAGTFFQSRRGIELLNRTFQVEYVGAPVESTVDAYPYVTSATLDNENGLVIFTLAQTFSTALPTGNSVKVMFDLTTRAWSTELDIGLAHTATSACMFPVNGVPAYHWITYAGTVNRRSATSHATPWLEGSSWRTMQVETAWFKPGGVSGYVRVNKLQLLCRKETNHNLVVSVGFNDRDAYAQTRTFTATEVNALTTDGEHLEIPLGNEGKCRTIRVKVADATPTTGPSVGTGKGATLYGLLVDFDPVGGAFRRPSAAR